MAAGGGGYVRLLAEQAAEADHLARDVRAREQERWQLLQLLEQKDRQLRCESAAAKRYKGYLAYVQEKAQLHSALLVFRAWAECIRHHKARRSLARVKGQLAEVQFRHGCSSLSACVAQALGRPLGHSIRALWLNAAVCSSDVGAAGDAVEDMPEDQVLFATPRSSSSCTLRRGPPTPAWRGDCSKPTRHGCPSSASEASTSMPSSSSVSVASSARTVLGASSSAASVAAEGSAASEVVLVTAVGSGGMPAVPSVAHRRWSAQTLPERAAGAARLAVALQAAALKRLLWGTSRLRGAGCSPALTDAPSTAHEQSLEVLDRQEAAAEAAEQRWNELHVKLQKESSDHGAELASLLARRDSLALRAGEMAKTESLLATRLARTRAEENADLGEARDGSLALEGASGSALAAHPSEVAVAIRLRLQACRQSCERANDEELQAERCLADFEHREQQAQRTSNRLETRIAREGRWREQATDQIMQMVARGEELESERSRLSERHAEARRRSQARSEASNELRHVLQREERANEALECRAHGLDAENLRLLGEVEDERGLRFQARRRRDDFAVAQREEARWRQECESAAREVLSLQRRRSAAQFAEEAEAAAAANAVHRAEAAICSRLTSELAQTTARVERLEADSLVPALASPAPPTAVPPLPLAHLGTSLEACTPGSSSTLLSAPRAPLHGQEGLIPSSLPGSSAMATPRSRYSRASSPNKSSTPLLDELDAYAALVQRLRAELERERDEREALTRNLANLRSSYQLLLQSRGGASASAETWG